MWIDINEFISNMDSQMEQDNTRIVNHAETWIKFNASDHTFLLQGHSVYTMVFDFVQYNPG